jgi:hypothetical protein
MVNTLSDPPHLSFHNNPTVIGRRIVWAVESAVTSAVNTQKRIAVWRSFGAEG